MNSCRQWFVEVHCGTPKQIPGLVWRPMDMVLLLAALLAFATPLRGAVPELPADVKQLLIETSIDTEWQQIFGMGIDGPARPAETWAQKFAAFQKVVAKSTGGKIVPIFLSPELAGTQLPAVPAKGADAGKPTIGIHLNRVPIIEALRYVANLGGIEMTVTAKGVLLDLPKTPKAK